MNVYRSPNLSSVSIFRFLSRPLSLSRALFLSLSPFPSLVSLTLYLSPSLSPSLPLLLLRFILSLSSFTVLDFCSFCRTMEQHNRQHVRQPFTRLIEVLCVTFLMTAVSFLLPMLWGTCTPKPVDMEDWTEQVRTRVGR